MKFTQSTSVISGTADVYQCLFFRMRFLASPEAFPFHTPNNTPSPAERLSQLRGCGGSASMSGRSRALEGPGGPPRRGWALNMETLKRGTQLRLGAPPKKVQELLSVWDLGRHKLTELSTTEAPCNRSYSSSPGFAWSWRTLTTIRIALRAAHSWRQKRNRPNLPWRTALRRTELLASSVVP